MTRGQLLRQVSCEPQCMSLRDFMEYVNDYTDNPYQYDISDTSEYYIALEWARDNLLEAYMEMIDSVNK